MSRRAFASERESFYGIIHLETAVETGVNLVLLPLASMRLSAQYVCCCSAYHLSNDDHVHQQSNIWVPTYLNLLGARNSLNELFQNRYLVSELLLVLVHMTVYSLCRRISPPSIASRTSLAPKCSTSSRPYSSSSCLPCAPYSISRFALNRVHHHTD